MKLLNFIKNNKAIVFAFVVVVLAFVFLALPGQFAHFGKNADSFLYKLSGYQFIFAKGKNSITGKLITDTYKNIKVIKQGVTIIVMLGLSLVGLLFSKKSSFVALLTSIILIVVAILFFTISVAGAKVYTNPVFQPADKKIGEKYSLYLWVPYVLGGLILIAGGFMLYRTILVLRDEVKHPVQQKGPSYNYLHK